MQGPYYLWGCQVFAGESSAKFVAPWAKVMLCSCPFLPMNTRLADEGHLDLRGHNACHVAPAGQRCVTLQTSQHQYPASHRNPPHSPRSLTALRVETMPLQLQSATRPLRVASEGLAMPQAASALRVCWASSAKKKSTGHMLAQPWLCNLLFTEQRQVISLDWNRVGS